MTLAWTSAGGLNASAWTFSNGNKTVSVPPGTGSNNIWTSLWANQNLPTNEPSYFEVACVGMVTGTASGVAIGNPNTGFGNNGSTTSENSPANYIGMGYNGDEGYGVAEEDTLQINPRQWPSTTPPPGFTAINSYPLLSGNEAFTYKDVSGNINIGQAIINTNYRTAGGDTTAWVPFGGAAGLETVVGCLYNPLNQTVTWRWIVVSTGFQSQVGPFPIPAGIQNMPMCPNVGCQTAFTLSEGLSATINGGANPFVMGLPSGYSAPDGGSPPPSNQTISILSVNQ